MNRYDYEYLWWYFVYLHFSNSEIDYYRAMAEKASS